MYFEIFKISLLILNYWFVCIKDLAGETKMIVVKKAPKAPDDEDT